MWVSLKYTTYSTWLTLPQPADTLLSQINKGHGPTGSMPHRLSVLAREAGFRGLFAGLGPRMIMTAGLVSSQFLMYGYIKTGSWRRLRSAPIYLHLPRSSRRPSRNRNPQRSQESIECCITLDVHPPWTFQLSRFMYDYYSIVIPPLFPINYSSHFFRGQMPALSSHRRPRFPPGIDSIPENDDKRLPHPPSLRAPRLSSPRPKADRVHVWRSTDWKAESDLARRKIEIKTTEAYLTYSALSTMRVGIPNIAAHLAACDSKERPSPTLYKVD